MLTIEYCKEGICVSDFLIEETIKKIMINYIQDGVDEVKVSSELLIMGFRANVKAGLISWNKIVFKFEDQFIYIDENGKIDGYPGFCCYFDEFLDVLIGLYN